MSERLPPPYGVYLHRDEPLSFEFEGVGYQGYRGDTLASALLGNGRWLLSRSFKYHRPRGPLSLAGQDANTLVQLPHLPNVAADTLALSEGLRASGQNYTGSLERDTDARLDKLGRFLKVGFYYRAFFDWRRWEPLIRRKAGLGTLPSEPLPEPQYTAKAYLFCDMVVVGAGPAGLSAALTGADAGADVLLIDAEPEIGGSLNYYPFETDRETTRSHRLRLFAEVEARANLRLLVGASVTGWFADHYLAVATGSKLYKVRARQTVFATGVYEQQAVFRNNDLPGVVLASAAMRLLNLFAVRPGKRAVVLTGDDDGYHCALALSEAGVEIAALLDLREVAPERIADRLRVRGIPVRAGYTVWQAHARHQHLTAVEIRAITGLGKVAPTGEHLECDLLCMSVATMPAWHLPCLAGARLAFDAERARFELTGLAAGVHLAGSIRGVHALPDVLADGEAAAARALASLGFDAPPPNVPAPDPRRYPWPIFPHPKGREFVDFDEDLQVGDLRDACALGYRDMQLLKRFSTLGMGPSQGRHSALAAARIVADETGRSVTDTGVTTARAPTVAEPLPVLAGRKFQPRRLTPMHARHLALGAQMMPAGSWLRPAYYGAVEARAATIAAEVTHVRNAVGLIDLSTLGGIELRGPHALELLNRLYTSNFSKLAVGRVRYALKCNLQGAVADDGVVFRLAEQHYYVTATTTGVDRVYREMTRWNAEWRLNVDIYNVTSAFAAVNLAGPKSRAVLNRLLPGTDWSHEALPYMRGLECCWNDVPLRVMRVGFVGELGFEVHLPTGFAAALWDALLEAGAVDDIRPFGVEAQRVLRLEKGHVIIGQDSDALTTPAELNMTWALAGNKPFYLGSRSLKILNAKALKRRLLAFELPANGPAPQEGELVVDGEEVCGHVTSVAFSPTLNRIIGLAFAPPKAAVLTILHRGQKVQAPVVPTPFFDPDNLRQQPVEAPP